MSVLSLADVVETVTCGISINMSGDVDEGVSDSDLWKSVIALVLHYLPDLDLRMAVMRRVILMMRIKECDEG